MTQKIANDFYKAVKKLNQHKKTSAKLPNQLLQNLAKVSMFGEEFMISEIFSNDCDKQNYITICMILLEARNKRFGIKVSLKQKECKE